MACLVVALRQQERQMVRDKERMTENFQTMEHHYVRQLTTLQEQLKSLEKERNLMMVTLRVLSESYMYGAIQQWNKGKLNLFVNIVSKKLTTLTIFNSIQKNNLIINNQDSSSCRLVISICRLFFFFRFIYNKL